jgi:phosphoglycolate phosphatase
LWVFDLDGTLIDSRRDIADTANQLLIECGVPPIGEDRIGRMVGEGAAMLVARAFKAAGTAPPPDALERFLAIYDVRLTRHTRPYDGMIAALAALRARGATLAVLTNKPRRATAAILERLDLAGYFSPELVFGGDGPFPRKPDPGGLRELMTRAGADARETLLVGDSLIDWRTARAAMTSICMATYGFGFEGFPRETLGLNDLRVDSPAGLLML